jgi:hypothetical protein
LPEIYADSSAAWYLRIWPGRNCYAQEVRASEMANCSCFAAFQPSLA